MFQKETKFQTAFVPVVKTQSLKSEHLFCTLKCLMKKVWRLLVTYSESEHCLFEKFEKNF